MYANSDSVYSVLDGKVSDSGRSTTLGNYIRVRHREIEITYSHLSQVFIHSGDSVQGGKVLGITGATGKVTGEHLHFSIRFRDKFIPPLKFLKSLFDLTNPPLNME